MEMVTSFNFEFMNDDFIREILLCYPCPASVACAAYFSRRLRRLVSDSHFHDLFRQRHPSSPLLGLFAPSDIGRLPLFENISSDTILDGMVCRADTGLAYLDKKKDWHLEDCRNGRLLLRSNDNSFCIYDPLSQRRVDCGSRPYDDEGDYLSNCLLEGLSCRIVSVQQRGKSTKALESFRFISLQRRRRRRGCQPEVRAVEYDSGTLKWISHPWNELPSLGVTGGAMHAAGHIFWEFNEAFLLVLDTDTMMFSMESIPPQLADKSLAIGELQDNKACAVCLQGTHTIPDIYIIDPQPHLKVRLQVWAIEKKEEERKEEGESRFKSFDWEMKEEVLVSDILDKDARVYVVTKVINGLVVIGRRSNKNYYVINLHSKTQVAEFSNRGPGLPYLYQLPWPPSVLAGATIMSSINNKRIVADAVSKQCPSSNKDGAAATTEERHISGDEVSKQCPSNKDVPATTDERYPLMTGSLNDISMDQLNLGENSREATVSSALVANTGEMMDRQKSLQDGYPLNMSEQNGVFCELDEQRPHPHSGGRTRLLGDLYAPEVTTSTAQDGPAQMGKRPRKKSTRYSEVDYICTQTRKRCKKL